MHRPAIASAIGGGIAIREPEAGRAVDYLTGSCSVARHRDGLSSRRAAIASMRHCVGDFTAILDAVFDEAFTCPALRKAERIGRPVGSPHGWTIWRLGPHWP